MRAKVVGSFPLGALLRDPRNPEILDLRVVSSDAEFVMVSTAQETRRYRLKGLVLSRWMLPARTPVVIGATAEHGEARMGYVLSIHGDPNPGHAWKYVVRTETVDDVVPEEQLRVVKVDSKDPLDRLEMNGWRGPRRFFGRLGLLQRTTVWKHDSEGVPAFLGARIEPLFHQYYAALRCLHDRETRFLLADEVGLGKTIEAGLVIQSLLAAKPTLRVLVVAPGTTSRQWLSELYARFGGRVFTLVDAVRYEIAEESTKTLNALLHSDRLIVTTALLRTRPKVLATIAKQCWDLLVVDEGHHLANWPELSNALRHISTMASSCLVLTATPGRGDDKGLLELLKLVAPSTYGNLTEGEFAARLEPQRRIAEKLLYSEELLAALLARGEVGEDDARELAEQWKGLFPDDAIAAERLKKMGEGNGKAAEELVAYVQEHYRVDRRIIRTRRRTLHEYGTHHASRVLEVLDYNPSAPEVEMVQQVEALLCRTEVPVTWRVFWSRYVCTTPSLLKHLLSVRLVALTDLKADSSQIDPLGADLGPAEEESALRTYLEQGASFPGESLWLNASLTQVERWLRGERDVCARFVAVRNWLGAEVLKGNRKVLVFSQSRHVIAELAVCLRANFGADAIAVMTHELDDDKLAEVARRFEKHPKCFVLLSDEVGAEGRNFQFADAVVHIDQPTIVARLEQRIGRLDRIGRNVDRPVVSVCITGPYEGETAVLEFHRDAVRVYDRSIGGLEYLLPRLQQDVEEAVSHGAHAIRVLADEWSLKLTVAEQSIDEAFSFFLDATRPELERARKLAELLADRTGDEDESYVRDWCKEVRVDLIQQEAGCVRAEVRNQRLEAPLVSLGRADWVKTGTFLRATALDDFALQYFAPGHLLVDALLQNAQEAHDARAAAFFRELGAPARGRVFAVVVGRLGPKETAWRGKSSPGLLRRAEYYLPVEWVASVWEISPIGQAEPVPSGALLEALCKDFQNTDRKCRPDEMQAIVDVYSGLWVGLRDAVDASGAAILERKKDEIAAAADELADVLRSEIAYLRSKTVHPGSDDTAFEVWDREVLLDSVRRPAVATDAVALVIGAGSR